MLYKLPRKPRAKSLSDYFGKSHGDVNKLPEKLKTKSLSDYFV